MDREIELKFLIAPEAADEALAHLPGEGAVRQLDATYFDTADHALRKAGFGLRVRDGEGCRKQTLKSASAGGVFARGEWETSIAGPDPDGDALAATPAGALLAGQALRPVFTTRVQRVTRMVRMGETLIEAALDRGELGAGERRAKVCELELELKAGSPDALFDLARELGAKVPLRLSLISKAERGYRLALAGLGSSPPRRASVDLDPAMTAGEALQAIGRAALVDLCAGVEALRDRPGPEGVHKLRIAVRRARVMLKIFRPITDDPAARALGEDLRWLAGELAPARDLDVFIADVWRPASGGGDDVAAFGRALLAAQASAYLRAEAALEGARLRHLLLEVAAWLQSGSWTTDPALAGVRDQPAAALAAERLSRLRHAVLKRGAHVEALDPEARHRLRLKSKTLRYAAEDLTGLFPDHPKRVERFIAAAKAFQDTLGRINDLTVRASLAHDVAIGAGGTEAAFAAGRLTASGGDEAALLAAACEARDALKATESFW